jgi:hypothetical protein
MPSQQEEAVFRRLELSKAGFTYCVPQGVWQRGHTIRLTDESIDRLEPWHAYIRLWTDQSPRRVRHSRATLEICNDCRSPAASRQ